MGWGFHNPAKGSGLAAHRAAGWGEEHFLANFKRAAGQDDEAGEQILQDFPPSQTNGETTHSSDGQHRVHCATAQGFRPARWD